MTDKEVFDRMRKLPQEYERLISRTLPVKIGVKAKSIFQENFRKGGFQDGGLQKWPVTRRQLLGKGAAAVSDDAEMWKRLALTKKETLTVSYMFLRRFSFFGRRIANISP